MTDRAAQSKQTPFFASKPLNSRSYGPDRFKTSAFYGQYSMVNEFPKISKYLANKWVQLCCKLVRSKMFGCS